ncbi:hypothetical protein [Leisingera sp. F5]|uniref:hypothetical protein n=1 Tax=Leisingera sp. F5 TaxID=1813816 RepID=UPI0025BB0257|nr:hypothetical protein [Leisingera sp. F5]
MRNDFTCYVRDLGVFFWWKMISMRPGFRAAVYGCGAKQGQGNPEIIHIFLEDPDGSSESPRRLNQAVGFKAEIFRQYMLMMEREVLSALPFR